MKRSSGVIRTMKTVLVVFAGFMCFTCDTENSIAPQVAFIKYYGREGNQEAVDIHVDSDGTVIMLGTSYNNGTSNIYLVKTDANGNVLKTATYGNGTDIARDLEPTFDGNYVVLAQTRIQDVDSVKLIKISPDLVKLDSVMDGFPGKNSYPNTVTALGQSGHNGFIVTGTTTYTNSENAIQSAMLLRYTDALDVYPDIWKSLVTNARLNVSNIVDVGVRTISLNANRFYVFGYTNVPPPGSTTNNFNVWYYGIDSTGNEAGNSFISYASDDYISESALSSIALGSIATSQTGTVKELLFTRYPIYSTGGNGAEVKNELGNPINTKLAISNSLRNLEAVKIVAKTSGDGYFVVANEIELDNSRNIWISAIDQAGNVLWSSNFGAKENDDRGAAVAELPTGRILVLGTMQLENQDKLALINLSGNGRLTN